MGADVLSGTAADVVGAFGVAVPVELDHVLTSPVPGSTAVAHSAAAETAAAASSEVEP